MYSTGSITPGHVRPSLRARKIYKAAQSAHGFWPVVAKTALPRRLVNHDPAGAWVCDNWPQLQRQCSTATVIE